MSRVASITTRGATLCSFAQQRPEATKVAGYRTWQQLGRQVRKGERAIMILAPIVYKQQTEDGADPSTESRVVRGFRSVPVFDLAQTDGDALPEIATRLQGSDPVYALRGLEVVAGELDYHVSIQPMTGTKNGECKFDKRVIEIRSGIAPAQMVKTLAHELGHVVLHNPQEQAKRSLTRPIAELEAESVAYVICREFGIDSGSYSFGYIAGWAGSGEDATKALEASASAIHRASHVVLSILHDGFTHGVDREVAELQRPRQVQFQELSDEIRGPLNTGNGGADWPEPLHHVNGQLRQSLLMTVPEACEALRVSRAQLYVMASKQHVIEMVHIGKLCRIPRASVEGYVEQLRQSAASQFIRGDFGLVDGEGQS
jgi:excisionase family DNA binding protein